jgi:mono/diheme cytochrome c family protein
LERKVDCASLAVLPALGWWYIRRIPPEVWASARGPMPTATLFALFAVLLLAVAFALALLTLVKPGRMHLAFSLVVALVALGAMGSFELVREAIRKPYVISNYLYANSLYSAKVPGDGGFSVDEVTAAGIIPSAKWVNRRDLAKDDPAAEGREIFRLECESCHTLDAYRGVKHYLAMRQWDQNKIQVMLGVMELMHNGVMPPFAGTAEERGALAAFLSTVQPVSAAAEASDGKTVYEQNCAMCHPSSAGSAVFNGLPQDQNAALKALQDLTSLSVIMPDLKLSERQRIVLVQWMNARRGPKGSGKPAPGGS